MKTWETSSGQTIRKVLGGRCNVYLIESGEKTMLVDASTGTNWKKLERALRAAGIARIDWLFLTHAHFDHIGNAERVRSGFGAKIATSRREADCIASGKMEFPYGTNPVTGALSPLYDRLSARLNPVKPFPCDLVIEGGMNLSELGFSGFILPTPGHSSGSMSIIVDSEIAICGDAAFGVFPKRAFPPFARDVPELLKSWEALVATGCTAFLPGHGKEITAAVLEKDLERRTNA